MMWEVSIDIRTAVRPLSGIFVLALLMVAIVGCEEEEVPRYETVNSVSTEKRSEPDSTLSKMAQAGEELFNANCSICHGVKAAGTGQGPTLIDKIYHPGHHPDFSFRNAVSNGVRQHHWVFGDMAPVAGVSSADVEKIICYVREIQRASGIFEGDEFRTVC